MNNLKDLGFTAQFEAHFAPHASRGHLAGRVALEHKHLYRVLTAAGEVLACVSGRMRFDALAREDYPAVGDWVTLSAPEDAERAVIHAVLPRRSKFSRRAAGSEGVEQIVAANVDTVFLVNALDGDFNLRRLERYLTLAWESGASPVIVLNKADLCQALDQRLAEVAGVAPGVPVHAVSAAEGLGIEALQGYLPPGRTGALLGSSGVGKSSLLNRLCGGERHATQAVREDDSRGRHTTSYRELVRLPAGGLLIDTPGMREIQLWDGQEGLKGTFQDVEAIAARCRFTDCRHGGEPGCAVRQALDSGELDESRLTSYQKLQRELAYARRKADPALARAERDRWKKLTASVKDRENR